jgi:UDP-2,3-diacylglucosamine pyrophosphatase LpxH
MKFKSIFISDVHLGFRGSRAKELLVFLKENTADTLYLVGDIIEIWSLKTTFYGDQDHTDVIKRLLKISKKGTKVIYIPGNHDEIMHIFSGKSFGGVEIHSRYIHQCVDGNKLLVLHGDEFDTVIMKTPWLAHAGSIAYDALITINTWVRNFRLLLGFRSRWSIASYAKRKVKFATQFISSFRKAALAEIIRNDVDGIITGHIHHAEKSNVDDIYLYMNTGDWVESATAIVENYDGTFSIIGEI